MCAASCAPRAVFDSMSAMFAASVFPLLSSWTRARTAGVTSRPVIRRDAMSR